MFEDGYPVIVDCIDHGRTHMQTELLDNPDLSREERVILRTEADPGVILLRLLGNLTEALEADDHEEDARLVSELRAMLE
jgi:hypothetical protein